MLLLPVSVKVVFLHDFAFIVRNQWLRTIYSIFEVFYDREFSRRLR